MGEGWCEGSIMSHSIFSWMGMGKKKIPGTELGSKLLVVHSLGTFFWQTTVLPLGMVALAFCLLAPPLISSLANTTPLNDMC
jgi:hypothetical protein